MWGWNVTEYVWFYAKIATALSNLTTATFTTLCVNTCNLMLRHWFFLYLHCFYASGFRCRAFYFDIAQLCLLIHSWFQEGTCKYSWKLIPVMLNHVCCLWQQRVEQQQHHNNAAAYNAALQQSAFVKNLLMKNAVINNRINSPITMGGISPRTASPMPHGSRTSSPICKRIL